MDIFVVDRNYELVDVIDRYTELVWAERFRGTGDFELHLPGEAFANYDIALGSYLQLLDSDVTMIVESIEHQFDPEDGSRVTVKGRSLESILSRRIIWGQDQIAGRGEEQPANLQTGLKRLFTRCIINPSDTARKIPNFTFVDSSDERISGLELYAQYYCDNLYDVVNSICEDLDLGFRVRAVGVGGYAFELYAGTDRSYAQNLNPYVVFSPEFDNLLDSDLLFSSEESKTVALVAGEGEGIDRELVTVGGGTGLDRVELYCDASDISKKVYDEDGNEKELSDREYRRQLTQKGTEELAQTKENEVLLSAKVDATRQFVYGKDFFLGDIVQVEDAFRVGNRYRVVEMIRSYSANGYTTTPTFAAIGD